MGWSSVVCSRFPLCLLRGPVHPRSPVRPFDRLELVVFAKELASLPQGIGAAPHVHILWHGTAWAWFALLEHAWLDFGETHGHSRSCSLRMGELFLNLAGG